MLFLELLVTASDKVPFYQHIPVCNMRALDAHIADWIPQATVQVTPSYTAH